jgi:hypothetical protein
VSQQEKQRARKTKQKQTSAFRCNIPTD